MDSIRQYILSVICTTVLCALVHTFLSGGTMGSLVKLITGLMVTLVVLNPVLDIDLIRIDTYFDGLSADGMWAAEEGKLAAMDVLSKRIKERTEAYICGKAGEMGASVIVDVRVSEGNPPVPEKITISGAAAPYIKASLSDCIEKDLGISEDDQIWIS